MNDDARAAMGAEPESAVGRRRRILGGIACETVLPWLKGKHQNRSELYDMLYSLDWGEATLNNYGFAPAEGYHPERFQLQMYDELYKILVSSEGLGSTTRLLEISCGRGGGICHLMKRWDGQVQGVGLDLSAQAVEFCHAQHTETTNAQFVRASAVTLPFRDAAFDIVVNIEAAHAYRDYAGFFREVVRVLRPTGTFMFADYCRRSKLHRLNRHLVAAGLAGDLVDVTTNVFQACTSDDDRRRRLIRTSIPWYVRFLVWHRLKRYAGLKGSRNWDRFRSADRIYFIGCLNKTATPDGVTVRIAEQDAL